MANKKILLVEDSAELCKLWEKLFRNLNYEFAYCLNGLEAVRKLETEEDFDLIISDYYLPDTNGLELIERIREMRPGIPCVMVTGSRETVVQDKLESMENTRFLSKPIRFAALESEIRKLLC